MKRVLCFVAAFALAAPVFAADPNVRVYCEDEGAGVGVVKYEVLFEDGLDSATRVRGFAFDVELNVCGSNITSIYDYDADGEAGGVSVVPAGYVIYMSSIDFGTDANNVDAWNDPVADPCDPGALGGLNTTGITIEMGTLVDSPPASGELFRFTVDEECDVTIAPETIRGGSGGIVLEALDGQGNAKPATLVPGGCTITTDCFSGTPEQEDHWKNTWGEPENWCWECWTCSDVDGNCFVTFGDVLLIFGYRTAADGRGDVDMNGFVTFGDVLKAFGDRSAGGCSQDGCNPCTAQ